MKNFSRLLSLPLIASILSSPALAAPPKAGTVERSLYNREMVYTAYRAVARDLADLRKQEALALWARAMDEKDARLIRSAHMALKDKIKNKAIVNLIAHSYFTNQRPKAAAAAGLYFHTMASLISEIAAHPLTDKSTAAEAAALAQRGSVAVDALVSCAGNAADAYGLGSSCITGDLQAMLQFVNKLANDKYYTGPMTPVGYVAPVPGNKVELLTQNRYGAAYTNYLAPLTNKILTGTSSVAGKRWVDMSVEDFKAVLKTREDADKLFTKQEGFPTNLNDPKSPDFHQLYLPVIPENGEKNIYGELYQAIAGAKETVYLDVYFFGGSAGVFLGKKLIEMVRKNPALNVVIMTDRWNTMAYTKELNVGFNFLRAYSENFPEDRILIMPPNIFLKRTSMPSFVDLMISDDLMRELTAAIGLQKNSNVYQKAKSDHSKVIIIDAKNPKSGVAFVGSKNITDTSGGIAYDESAKIQGPAVKVIQDSYYYDLFHAIELEHEGAAKNIPGYTENNKRYIQSLFAKAAKGTGTPALAEMIATILKPVDMLERTKPGYLQNLSVPTEAQGNTTIQIAENNVYGNVRTALVQDVQLILSAREQIIISDQFLFDPTVVEALIQAMQKNPSLKVYIMLASLADLAPKGKPLANFPNNLYYNDLVAYPQVKFKFNKVPTEFMNAVSKANSSLGLTLSPEYHLKGISIDGVTEAKKQLCGRFSNEKSVNQADGASAMSAITGRPVLVSGSANKDFLTMMGGFREFQVAIFDDKAASAKHDCLFWSRFTDPDHSENVDMANMNLPPAIKAKGITEKMVLDIVKRLLNGAYDFRMW